MSTSRISTFAFRTVTRRAARIPTSRQLVLRPAARRGYASGGHDAEKSSDLPWLIASVGITIPTLAWLLSGSPKKPAAHGSSHESSHGSAEPEPAPAAESSDSSSDTSSESSSGDTPPPSDSDTESSSSPPTPSSQTGQQVPPTSADNTDMSTDPEGKKAAQEDYKQIVRAKDTRAATSSSDIPSKKAAAEHPREDPQGGEGEGVKKGGPE